MPEKQEREKKIVIMVTDTAIRIITTVSFKSMRYIFRTAWWGKQPLPRPSTRWCCLTAGDRPAVQLWAGGKILILKNVSLLDILSVQNIFLWDDPQSNSAHSHSDFAILLIDYFRKGTLFSPWYVQRCLFFSFLSHTRNACYSTLSPSSLKSVD